MKHVKDPEHFVMIGFIELINVIGLNLVSIDNTFYVFTEFLPVDEVINEIELVGRNVTFLIENQTANAWSTQLKKTELIQKIMDLPSRRRVFTPGTEYVKYLST